MTMPSDITIDRFVFEMAQIEIHVARNALATALLRAQMLAKRNPLDNRAHELVDVLQEVQHKVDNAMLKALNEHRA